MNKISESIAKEVKVFEQDLQDTKRQTIALPQQSTAVGSLLVLPARATEGSAGGCHLGERGQNADCKVISAIESFPVIVAPPNV